MKQRKDFIPVPKPFKNPNRFRLVQGFTLIELLIVIAIIGILASVIFANVFAARKKATLAKAQYAADALKKIIQLNDITTVANVDFSAVSGMSDGDPAIGYATDSYTIYSIDNGSANWSTDTPVKNGFSLFLDSAERLIISNPFVSQTAPDGLSLGMWIKPENNATFLYNILLDATPGQEDNFLARFSYDHDSGTFGVEHGLISSPGITGATTYNYTLPTGEWSYVVWAARNGEVEIWINGEKETEILDADIEVPEVENGAEVIAPNTLINGDQLYLYNPTQFIGFFNPAQQ